MKSRNISLDLFRGFTVLWMVIVNNPGNWGQIYSFFKHASWNGLGSADFVFPFFLIAVGASIPFAYSKRKSLLESDSKIISHVLIRSIILVSIGLILNGFPDYNLSELRIPGVLQRIGIVYFFTYLIYLSLNSRLRLILFSSILLVYSYVIVYCPPPDWDYLQNPIFQYDAKFNLAAYIDRLLMSEHLWKLTKVWDPEGLLSSVPSIASALMGIWLSEWMIPESKAEIASKGVTEKGNLQESKQALFSKSESEEYYKNSLINKSLSFLDISFEKKVTIAGITFIVLGLLVGIVFPINKSLWSSSFVLVTGGIAYLFLILLHSLPKNWQQSKVFDPILMLGRSALFVFVFTGFFSRILNLPLWENLSTKTIILDCVSIFSTDKTNSLFYSLVYLSFTLAITWTWRKVYQRI
jgi:predicted acyltransferase